MLERVTISVEEKRRPSPSLAIQPNRKPEVESQQENLQERSAVERTSAFSKDRRTFFCSIGPEYATIVPDS